MFSIALWALLTGVVTGGVWLGIVLATRRNRLLEQDAYMLDEMRRRLELLESVEKRLAEVEERLDFAERMLTQQREPDRLPPPGG